MQRGNIKSLRHGSGLEVSTLMAVKTSEITLAQAFLAPFGMWWSVVEREEKIELHSGKVVEGRVWVDSDEGGSLEVEVVGQDNWVVRDGSLDPER